jgi:hypothetical protein
MGCLRHKTVLLPHFVVIVTLKSSRPPAGGLALNYDKITGSAKPSISLLKENKMIDIIIDISKIGIRSIFTAKKYDTQILDEYCLLEII